MKCDASFVVCVCINACTAARFVCLFHDASGGTVVQTEQTRLCKSVCLRRTCVSMLQRLIRGFLKIVASRRTSVEDQIRFSLQRDVPGHPYVFEVNFFDGGLSRSVFIGMDGIGEEEHIRIPYALGTP